MKTIEFEGHKVEIYNSPEDMPMKRYNRFNKFLMIDNEVGFSFEDYNKRSAKTYSFMKRGMNKEAMQELKNRNQMVFNAFMEYNPKGRAMAILVHSINNTVFRDYSGDGLDKVLDELEKIGFAQRIASQTVDEAKKKIESQLSKYFPSRFKSYDGVQFNNELIKMSLLEVRGILYGSSEELENQIGRHDKNMLSMNTPSSWNINAKDNMERRMEIDFEKYLFAVAEHTKIDVEEVSVYRFYALEEFIREKLSKNKS